MLFLILMAHGQVVIGSFDALAYMPLISMLLYWTGWWRRTLQRGRQPTKHCRFLSSIRNWRYRSFLLWCWWHGMHWAVVRMSDLRSGLGWVQLLIITLYTMTLGKLLTHRSVTKLYIWYCPMDGDVWSCITDLVVYVATASLQTLKWTLYIITTEPGAKPPEWGEVTGKDTLSEAQRAEGWGPKCQKWWWGLWVGAASPLPTS